MRCTAGAATPIAITAAGLRLAAEAGYRTAVLPASRAGAAVYRRLGFRDVGSYLEHAVS